MYNSGEQTSTTGTLKTTISLGKNPSIVHSGPFYLMKDFNPDSMGICGSTNLLAHYNLEHSYNKFSGKKIKEQLSSFLPNLPGVLDVQQGNDQDNSTLRSVIEKPPIGGKELLPLTSFQLAGFRLHPGPLPEQYKYLSTTPTKKHKHKNKKHKKEGGVPTDTSMTDLSALDTHEKKHKKQKRHEDDKERKKRKKEKKRKKQRPEHPEQVI